MRGVKVKVSTLFYFFGKLFVDCGKYFGQSLPDNGWAKDG